MSAANEMPAGLLAALKADIVAGRWRMMSVNARTETVSVPSANPMQPPAVSVTRHVTATLTAPARKLTIVCELSGPGDGSASSLTLYWQGTGWSVPDAALIARIEAAVAPMMASREAELLDCLTATLPEA